MYCSTAFSPQRQR
uniref:Uncharacterized protein n=1 Tax=Anguilla anguilla TaxID=7936 RepID=A0A0E9VU62_ANGAN